MFTEEYARQITTQVVLSILESLVEQYKVTTCFDSEQVHSVELSVCVFMEQAVELLFAEVGKSARAVCEQSGRTMGSWKDVGFTLETVLQRHLTVEDVLQRFPGVFLAKAPTMRKRKLPHNPFQMDEADTKVNLSGTALAREHWMPPFPPDYTYKCHEVYFDVNLRNIETERSKFLQQKQQIEKLLLSQQYLFDSTCLPESYLDQIPPLEKAIEQEEDKVEERELLEFFTEETVKDTSKTTVKAERSSLLQRFERIVTEMDGRPINDSLNSEEEKPAVSV